MKHIDVRIECSDQFQVFVHDVLLAVEKEYPVTAQITVTELPLPQVGEDKESSCCGRCWKNDGHCPHYKRGLHHCLYFIPAFIPAATVPPPRGEIENKCEWRCDTDGFWHTNCGGSFTLNTGELKQNEFNYCHKCGRKIYEMYPVEPAAPIAPAVETEMGMTPSTKAFLKKAGVKVKTVDDVFLKNILANSGNNPQPPCPSCEKLRAENTDLKSKFGFTYCAYCGKKFPIDAPDATDAISEHVAACEKHPMRKMEAENEKLRAENAELKWKIAELKQNNEQVDYKYHDRD